MESPSFLFGEVRVYHNPLNNRVVLPILRLSDFITEQVHM